MCRMFLGQIARVMYMSKYSAWMPKSSNNSFLLFRESVCVCEMFASMHAEFYGDSVTPSPTKAAAGWETHWYDGTYHDLFAPRNGRLAVFEDFRVCNSEVESMVHDISANFRCKKPVKPLGTVQDELGCMHYLVEVQATDVETFGRCAMDGKWNGKIGWFDMFLM